ncbi:MAG: Hsp20/alpha crystallin family protein [Planctomycetota bacterium]
MPVRYQMQRPLNQLRSEMDRLVSGFMAGMPDGPWFGSQRSQPAVNVWEEPEALKIEAELPGLKQDQVEISVVGNELALKVTRPDVQQTGVVYHRRERPVGTFTRILRLPTEVDADHVHADLKDGVLLITLAKAEKAKPRKINVTSA